MAIHEDGTMDVFVGGKVERRPYQITMGNNAYGMPSYDPILKNGEAVLNHFGNNIPLIFKRSE